MENKFYFSIYLFKIIKILSGYSEPLHDGIAIHLTKNTAKLFLYKDVLSLKKSVKPLKDYHIIKFYSLIEIGSEYNIFYPTTFSFVFNYLENIIKWFLFNKKPYLKINNTINIYDDKEIFDLYIKATVILNVLMIVLSLIKICVEKIINGIAKRKQNKFDS